MAIRFWRGLSLPDARVAAVLTVHLTPDTCGKNVHQLSGNVAHMSRGAGDDLPSPSLCHWTLMVRRGVGLRIHTASAQDRVRNTWASLPHHSTSPATPSRSTPAQASQVFVYLMFVRS